MVRGLGHGLSAGVVVSVVVLAAPAAARAAPERSVDVPAGPLEASLLTLGQQTGEQLFFPKALVAGRVAPAVKGVMTAEAAAAQLLAGTGLSVTRAGPRVLLVAQAPAAAGHGPVPVTDPAAPFGAAAGGGDDASTGATAPGPTVLQELQVTGSNIRGAPAASPLVTLNRDDLDRTGRTTVAEALRSLPENFSGGAADANATTGGDRGTRNSGFGTGVNLRGLGNNATLVLVNGRRLAGGGSFGDFVDVSTIPNVAVERVDVLLDGASAIYGSDAVGGVVNIRLRQPKDGGEVRVMGGLGTRGEPAEGQVSALLGRRWSSGGVLLAYELQRRDDLPSSARDFAQSDLRALGGTDNRIPFAFPGNIFGPDPVTGGLVPLYGVPAGQSGVGLKPSDVHPGVVNLQDQREGSDILPRQTLNAVYLAADQAVGERVQLTADARFSSRRFKAHLAPPTATFVVSRANPFYVSPVGAASETLAYSFAGDLPSIISRGQVDSLGANLGATVSLPRSWRLDSYVGFGQELTETRATGGLNSLLLAEALGNIADRPDTPYSAARDGYFNPFTGVRGANPAAVMAAIGSADSRSRFRSRVWTANLQVDGTLATLPGGPLQVAFGGQARREALRSTGSNWTSTPAPVAVRASDAQRDITAGFAELRVPLFGAGNARPGLQRLELSLAGRIEHYQVAGTTRNPKVGVLWAPTQDVTVRATYGRSFRAPALRELNDPETYAPTLLPIAGGARVRSLILIGGNPALRPETAVSWTGGVDWTPSQVPGLRLSLTGFDVRFRNRIGQPVQTNLVGALTDPTLATFVTRISPATNAADLARIQALLASPALSTANGVFAPEAYGAIVEDRYVNTATLKVRGLDVSGSYGRDAWGGRLLLSGSASYLLDYQQQITPTTASVQEVGVANFPVRFRGRLNADWSRGAWGGGVSFDYVGRYHDMAGVRIAAQPTVDLRLRWAPEQGRLAGTRLDLAVRNLFDRDPPFYNNAAYGIGYDAANADPIGRFVSLELTRTW
jgi:outer membrane receptor protein involved in Fe transport